MPSLLNTSQVSCVSEIQKLFTGVCSLFEIQFYDRKSMRIAYVNVLSHLTPQKNLASTLKLIWVSLGSLYTQRTIYKTINGIRTFSPEQLLPMKFPPRQLPLNNYSPPRELPPMKFPQGQLLLPKTISPE